MIASQNGHTDTAALLIKAGAKPDLQNKVREGGWACSSCCSSMCVCLCYGFAQQVSVSTMFGTHPKGARLFAKCIFLGCAE